MLTSLAVAAALIIWPPAVTTKRLLRTRARPRLRWRPQAPPVLVVAGIAGVAGWLTIGAGGAVAGALAGATLCLRHRSRYGLRDALASMANLAEALRSLVAELAAGSHPVDAAERVAADADPTSGRLLRSIASAVRLGGEPEITSTGTAGRQLVKAWRLATRHGLPLADVLDAVSRDLDQRVRFGRQVQARMAGPRASGAVLAAMPVLGVALGEAMGARPLSTLAGTPAGQVLLAAGVTLICAGVVWTARLTDRAVPR
ncbi:type II secretion system F family protein [Actinokineospora sp. NBRC 105648]|uniref:type II secretion system F family protein n=1 Tax=Actinokineospora sp. NBRC 105648 TaxID=3032206 RepID=UPI0024A2C2E6|nr:type II secretion system F family protein [Actinokineospora sp. NBRC 105648]GLZ40979.1 type II secretion system protein [Actinokineospora sp. NBRC 105648]